MASPTNSNEPVVCQNCGVTDNKKDAQFCYKCGDSLLHSKFLLELEKDDEIPLNCPKCGGDRDAKDVFCPFCGHPRCSVDPREERGSGVC